MSINNSNNPKSNTIVNLIKTFLNYRTIWYLDRKRVWLALALLTGGLLLTLTICLLLKADVETKAENEFDLTCTDLNNRISARLYTHAQLVRSGVAFFENSETVNRNKWKNFSASQRVEKNSKGIRGIGYVSIIRTNQFIMHEKEIQHEGFPQYSVIPAGKREIYTPVTYIEPFSDENLRLFGYDIFSNPVCRKAMEVARDLNTECLTHKITPVQGTNGNIQADALMFAPVYKTGMPKENIKERRNAIQGWVFITYKMDNLITGIFEDYKRNGVLSIGIIEEWQSLIKRNIRLEIFDDFSFNQNVLLYDNRQTIDKKVISYPLFSLKYSVSFGNTLWYSRFTQYAPAGAGLDYSKVWYAATGGTGISILLFVVYLLLINTNIRAYELAEKLTRGLSESETKYSSMIFNISDVICIIGENGVLKYISPNIEKWFGGWQPQDLTGTDGWLMVHPDDLERTQKKFFSLLEKDNSVKTMEFRLKCKDGSYKPIHLTAVNLMNDPVINGILANYHDITERKQAEEALRESEQNYRNLADSGPALVWASGTDKLCYYFNRVWFEFTGRTPEQETGNGWAEGVHPEDLQYCLDIYTGSFDRQEKFNMDYRLKRYDGEYRWLQDNGYPKYNSLGKFTGYIGHCIDITERKQSEETLRLRESYLSAIIENQQGMFWLKDMNGKVLMVNRKFSDSLGVDNPESFVGKTDFDLWPQELADKYIAEDNRVTETKTIIVTENYTLDNDRVRWSETFKAPVIDNQGMVIGTTGYSVDITERKVAELALLKLNEDLQISKMYIEENLVQEHVLVEELTLTKEMLEKINSEKDKLFSIIANNLKSPFQGFMGLTESMAENIDSFSQAELSEIGREMHITSKNIYTMLTNLLEWARMQQGMIKFNPTEIVLSDIVSENIDSVSYTHLTLPTILRV